MTELAGVRAKLKAHKDANTGTRAVTLDESGVTCAVPNWINHGLWMRAQRIAKGDTAKAQAAFVAEAVLFEGEKLTITDLAELVPAARCHAADRRGVRKDSGADTDGGEEGNGTIAH